jgi:hypothetical protein
MRILLASAAAAAIAFTATPAFAQYGGSPAEQVDGAPAEADAMPAPEDEMMPAEAGDLIAPDADPDPDMDVDVDTDLAADTGGVAGGGKPAAPAEDYALADTDVGMADMDADVDADMDADEVQPAFPGEADEAGEMTDEADDAGEEAGPEDQGEPSRD